MKLYRHNLNLCGVLMGVGGQLNSPATLAPGVLGVGGVMEKTQVTEDFMLNVTEKV
jgi:hypothetical protein